MTGSNIARASLWGITLIGALSFIVCSLLIVFAGCAHVPPGPDPGPSPPEPPGPGATPCQLAELQSRHLGCSVESETAAWVYACERYTAMGGAFDWHPDTCMRWAVDCPALEACRGGSAP